jgi:hypothetical protein
MNTVTSRWRLRWLFELTRAVRLAQVPLSVNNGQFRRLWTRQSDVIDQ